MLASQADWKAEGSMRSSSTCATSDDVDGRDGGTRRRTYTYATAASDNPVNDASSSMVAADGRALMPELSSRRFALAISRW